MKALRLDILKYKGTDCSNYGISNRYNEILLVCDEGNIEIDETNLPENLCKIVEHRVFGEKVYAHVEPVAKPNGIGWMAGGCVVYTCDSRFRTKSMYPLCLHDRCESQEEYNILSN